MNEKTENKILIIVFALSAILTALSALYISGLIPLVIFVILIIAFVTVDDTVGNDLLGAIIAISLFGILLGGAIPTFLGMFDKTKVTNYYVVKNAKEVNNEICGLVKGNVKCFYLQDTTNEDYYRLEQKLKNNEPITIIEKTTYNVVGRATDKDYYLKDK